MEENKIEPNIEPATIGYLGVEYQEEFIAELIIDVTFAEKVITFVKTDNFENEQMRSIVGILKNFHEKYHRMPNFKELTLEIKGHVKNEINQELQLKLVDNFKTYRGGNMYIQEKTEEFFLQQNMLRAIAKINKLVANGDSSNYRQCEEIFRNAFIQNNRNDIGTFIYDELHSVYEVNSRNPTPLGLPGLDKALNGGLASGELMIMIAPLGTGKTTFSTYVASNVMRSGRKVLQIYFEDTKAQILQKHAACIHNLPMEELNKYKEECLAKDKEDKELWGNNLIIKKFKGDSTHVSTIRAYINQLKSIGFIPELVIIDYLDCLTPEKHERFPSATEAEKAIVKQVESLVDELQIACLTYIQANRGGIDNDDVGVKDSGGSISRAQIGHIIATLSKSPEQGAAKLASLRIKKSRVGDAPVSFVDIKFNNQKVQIDIPENILDSGGNYLSFMIEQQTGKTQEEYLKEAKQEILRKRKEKAAEEERIEAEKLNNQSVSDIELNADSLSISDLETAFNNENQ